jgi:hypothetical protein
VAEHKEQDAMAERLDTLERDIARLRRQNADMVRDLEAANQRVRELESARDFALDRIDWALDSLHTVLEEGQ